MSLRSLPTGWPSGVDPAQVVAYTSGEGIRDEGTGGTIVTYMYLYLSSGPILRIELGKSTDPDTLEMSRKIAAILLKGDR